MSSSERFIPIRMDDAVAVCRDMLRDLPADNQQLFEQLAEQVQRHYHQQFFGTLRDLKSSYQNLNPDDDLQALQTSEDTSERFWPRLYSLLQKGNFEPITTETLEQAMKEESLFKVRLAVDFDYFEEVLFFYRGEQEDSAEINSLFGLKKRTLEFARYDRVVMYVKFKPQSYFDEREIDTAHFTPGATLIKLFKNVPKADLEMLFPNAEVRMRTFDKVMIGGPALIGGGVLVATKLGSTLVLLGAFIAFWLGFKQEPVSIGQAALVSLGLGLGALAGHLWKQFSKFKNRKISFMKKLSENLYFKNLDNNAGVFHYLINMAEEEECKEVLLAYAKLLAMGEVANADELDKAVEVHLRESAHVDLDFEIHDALSKLYELGFIEKVDEQLKPLPLKNAVAKMNEHWQAFANHAPDNT